MKQHKLLYIFIFSLFFCFGGNAQNKAIRSVLADEYNNSKNKQLIEKIKEESKAERQKVLEYSRKYDIESAKSTKDGRFLQLKRIDDFGNPIYYTTFNEGSRITSEVDALQNDQELGVELLGQNMIVAVIDGQLVFDKHQEFLQSSGSKIKTGDVLPKLENLTEDELKTFQNSRMHATHVAGTIAARGLNPRAKGIAPQADVWSYNWNEDIVKMTEIANNGILVSNHSYGISAIDDNKIPLLADYYFGAYTKDAQNFDEVAFAFPFFQPVIAAGNDRQDYELLNPQKGGNDLLLGAANAKNAIVVGAVKEVKEYQGINSVEMSDFSSFGPTNDFRIKPDVVGQGVEVYSSIYTNPKPINSIPANNYYGILSGTSMAVPVVSGIIALWQQWAVENRQMPYKASTIKAIAIHTANKAGYDEGPDNKFGWGLINAKNGVILMQNQSLQNALIEENTLFEGSLFTQEIEITENKDNLSFTLVWTDPAGDYAGSNFEESPQLRNLVNDLDMRIIKDNEEYLPWKLTKDFINPYPVKGDNDVDNVEKVEIKNAEKGTYKIVISHKNNLKYKRQDFSLLVSDQNFGGISVSNTNTRLQNQIEVWPNPVSEYVNIEIPSEYALKDLKITVFDLNGRLIKEVNKIKTTSLTLPTSSWIEGVYLIKIEGSGLKKIEKVVKK